MWAMMEKLRMNCGSGISVNAECKMQNAALKAEPVLHSAFCILHSSNPPLVPAIETHPLIERDMREHDRNYHGRRHDSRVQMKDQHRGHAEGDEREVDGPDARAAAAGVLRSATRAGAAQRAASPRSFSTITASRHLPSSLAWRSYVPTSRKPSERRRARLASFSTMTRETSFQKPAPSAASMSASMATRPAPRRRAFLAT